MPGLRTYHDGKNIYSVDMMLAYLNTQGHPTESIPVDTFRAQMEKPVWGDWSPKMVLDKMDTKKYSRNAERIRKADVTYPIIITGKKTAAAEAHTIVDGYHRVAKAFLDKNSHIKAYVFDASLMNKFILDKDMNFVKVHQQMDVNEILELWTQRFC